MVCYRENLIPMPQISTPAYYTCTEEPFFLIFFSQLIWHGTVAVPCLLIWVGSVCRLGPRYGRFVYPSVFRTVKNFLNRVRYLWVQLGVVRFSLSLVPEGGADVSSEVPVPTRNGKGGGSASECGGGSGGTRVVD